jgi:hypothetical protein
MIVSEVYISMVIRTLNQSDIQQEPYQVWNSFVDLLTSEDFEDLNDIQRIAYLCFWYDSEVMNGGHLQYFENRGTVDLKDTVNALMTIGANSQAKLLEDAYYIYSGKSRKQIHTIQDYVDVADDGEFDEFDNIFYDCKPQIQDMLEEYLNKHIAQFVEII